MNTIRLKKNVFSFELSWRRIGLWCALASLALPVLGATTNKVYIGMAPQPISGYITNTAPTNLTANATNDIVDLYGFGVEISLTARENAGMFSYWSGTLAGNLVDSNNPVISGLTVDSDGSLIANFAASAKLQLSVPNVAYGTTIPATGSYTVPVGRATSVTAVPAAAYEFDYWKVESGLVTIAATNAATTTVTVTSVNPAPHVRAYFRQKTQLSVAIVGPGNVLMSSASVAPIVTNLYYFPVGETVSLTALPSSGNEFKYWTGVPDPLAFNTSILMTNNQSISVQFGPIEVKKTLVVLAKPNGTAAPAGTNLITQGSMVEISASPNPGYAFWKWTQTNGVGPVSGDPYANPATYVMNIDRNFLAWFTNLYTVTVSERQPGVAAYTVDVLAGQPWSIEQTNRIMAAGTTARYYLYGWESGSGDVLPASGFGSLVSVNKATQNSGFTWDWRLQYYLTGDSTPGGSLLIDEGWKDSGTVVTLTAQPDPGYFLSGWLVNGIVQPSGNLSLQVTMDESKTVQAVFATTGADNDGDGLADEWEIRFGLDPNNKNGHDGADGDPDLDGLSNLQELLLAVTNVPAHPPLYMNPINADTDGDGMDDYFEAFMVPSTNFGDLAVSAALIPLSSCGPDGNPDGDSKWDTETGYQLLNQPLRNIDEWRGPDGVDPCGYETVSWNVAFPAGSSTPHRKDVVRRTPAWPARDPLDTNDQSHPGEPDTDNDGFDDGYEFSWDQWHQAYAGTSVDPATNWLAITALVPPWPDERRYNPSVPLFVTPDTLEPDFDWLYNTANGQANRPYSDLDEYQASIQAGSSNLYPVVRVNQRPEPWCTNPFLWDTDGDALPDGWEMTFGYDPWSRDSNRNGITDANENSDGDACAFLTVPMQIGDWLVSSNDVEEVTTNEFDEVSTNITTFISTNFVATGLRDCPIFHNQVYLFTNFNPWTAWLDDKERMQHSAPFNNIMEFAGAQGYPSYLAPLSAADLVSWEVIDGTNVIKGVLRHPGINNNALLRLVPAIPHWQSGTETTLASNPRDVDTDKDGMWDGWEFYFGFNPQVATEAGENFDKPWDALLNWQEFIGYEVLVVWQGLIDAARTSDSILPAWRAFSQSWPNKHLPTDPYNDDTDHDQLFDSQEQIAFNYATNGIPGAGSGLDPDSVDTDLDYLPDAWESYWGGGLVATNDTNGVAVNVWSGGTDGTVSDALLDTDGDGLFNYQEYMVGACYQFQYMYNNGDSTFYDPQGTENDPYDFFNVEFSDNDAMVGPGGLRSHYWDPAYWADRMWPVEARTKPFTFLSGVQWYAIGEGSINPSAVHFSTCNPGASDTDGDGYDDFYELYHCLNPIRGNPDNDLIMVKTGMGMADPLSYDAHYRWGERDWGRALDYDQDGQVDVEENITPNLSAVQTYSHTDPSPYFVSDVSSSDSYVNRFYKTGDTFGGRMYWYWDDLVLMDMNYPAAYLFSFEMNEGFDTDNDLAADGEEIIGKVPGATDPLDEDSPLRQRALFVDGVDSAARLYRPSFHGWHSFRAFTVEAWVKPISLDGDRVIVERAGMVAPGNPGFPSLVSRVTRNFRLGIKEGIPYVSFDGYGVIGTNVVSGGNQTVQGQPQFKLRANQWTHLAGVYDPTIEQLMILVNGELAASKNTTQIPFNGFIGGNPDNEILPAYGMGVSVGAADEAPTAVCDGTRDDIKSGFYKWQGFSPGNRFPVLTNFFHGWIDEVHLWDGARSGNQIRDLYRQKMTRLLINSINGVQTGNQSFQGDMGGNETNPKMLYCFTFDALPNPDNGPAPSGFESTLQPVGNIPWLDAFPQKSTVYNNYEYVKWIQNMASHQPFDPPRDTRMLRWIVDGKTQNFPNSSNPYTQEYIHGFAGSSESHPQYGPTDIVPFTGLSGPSAERWYSGVYGDLLPLGGARGDDTQLMWDGSTPVDLARDQDGDGIPDIWEETHGMDPHDPLDADNDPDRDGLSTRQEYQIGSDPFGSFSLSPSIPDFFAYTNGIDGPYRFIGEQYTDMDYMDDLWEAAYRLNTEMYDATGPNADPDNDGWSNLSEFQELANLRGTGTGLVPVETNLFDAFTPLADNAFYLSLLGDLSFLQNQSTNATNAVIWQLQWNDPQDERFHPIPELIFRFQYAGKRRAAANPRFVVLTYTDRLMDIPDASIRGTADRSLSYPRYMALNQERANSFSYEGHVREGNNWFWGFMDLNGDNQYQANEPGGFAGPVNVRWGSVGPIDIPLTDIRPNGFARFSWTPDPNAEQYRVLIVDKNTRGSPRVFDRTFSHFRTFVHEGDLRYNAKTKNGFPLSGGYQWYVRSEYDNLLHDVANGMAYVKYTTPLPAPVLVWPTGNARLRQSLDTFVWKMDPSVTLCNLKVKRRDTGAVVLNYGFIPPPRSLYGRFQMRMPIYIGDGVLQNGVYDYTLTVKNRASSAAATSQFTVRIGDYPGYSYSLSGVFIYPGKATTGTFVAEAFTSPGFGGVPAGRTLIANTIKASAWPTNLFPFVIRGLPADDYYVRVFLDQNNAYPNYVADDFESQGWNAQNFYWARPVAVSGSKTAVIDDWIKVLMRDLDNDRIPDDWEYRWNRNFTTFGLGNLRGYVPAVNGVLNVFECYGYAPLGVSPR